MATHEPIVAIDGPAGSGKSTVARAVARRAGLQFVSSGALYRAVALRALRQGVPATDRARLIELADSLNMCFATDSDGVMRAILDGEDVTDILTQPNVAQIASVAATIPELRERLVAKLQEYGNHGGIVMEGRDIQTVVFPNADIKLFVTASPEERARRRWKELMGKGENISYAEVLAEARVRDQRDEEREASPLRAAQDAIRINTDNLTIDQTVDCILRIVEAWRHTPTLHGGELAREAGCGEGVY